MAGVSAEFLSLTTIGRVSGEAREIEIWFTEHAGRYYVIAEHGERARWVQNLRADPIVRVRVADRSFATIARVVDPIAEPTLSRAVRGRSEAKYGWGDGLVIELVPSAA